MTRREGFAGQRMQVLPAPRVADALQQPVLRRLLVTDCGYFPAATDHFRRRARGAHAAIVLICTEGAGFVDLGRGRRPVRPGQAVVIPPGQPHSYGADAANPWTIWWAHVAGDEAAALAGFAAAATSDGVLTVARPERAAGLIEEILDHLELADTDLALTGACGAAWHLLTLLRVSGSRGEHADPVRETIIFLRDHPGRRRTVAELAARVGLSPSHFAALFKRTTGLPVLQYQIRLAMNEARVLLDGTDLPVAAIATRLGYDDAFYFARQFRAVHQLTPSQFRRQGARG